MTTGLCDYSDVSQVISKLGVSTMGILRHAHWDKAGDVAPAMYRMTKGEGSLRPDSKGRAVH